MKTTIEVRFKTVGYKSINGIKTAIEADKTYLGETLIFRDELKTKHMVNKCLDYSEGMLRDIFVSLFEANKKLPSKLFVLIKTDTGLTFNSHSAAEKLNGSVIAKNAYTISITKADKANFTANELAGKYVSQFRQNIKFINTFVSKRETAAANFDTETKALNNLNEQTLLTGSPIKAAVTNLQIVEPALN